MIANLQDSEIFVFGSNLEGQHAGGAAKQALDSFGAIWGIGVGIQGQCYAIPTMPPLGLIEIQQYIKQFINYASITPAKTYLVTAIGQGIAGYSPEEMKIIWNKYSLPTNIKFV